MKKIIAITLIGALVLGLAFTGVANAQSPKDKARGMPQMGTVERISANSVILKAPGMDFITIEVTTNDETVYYDATGELEKGEKPPEIKWNEIKKGDKIIARGKIVREDEDSPTYYLAISVTKINQFPRPERPGDDKGRDNVPPSINVIFKSVSGNTLTVTDPSGEKEFEIIITDETKFAKITRNEDDEKPGREEISLGNLSEGDKLVINGKREKDDDGNVTITARMILVVENFPKNDRGRDG
ncbi:MAG: hypothetical protein KAH30_03040, partial [Caldisericia bacterium]|nr:hypothetical protein [Caldisericia bacterium]